MVWLALKASLREASCCKVEVVKGGKGLRRTVLRSTDDTWKGAPAAILATADCAAASLGRSNFSSLRPSRWVRRAVKTAPSSVAKITETVQYSCDLKASISASRSHTRRSATDWTRPAERLPGSLRQS